MRESPLQLEHRLLCACARSYVHGNRDDQVGSLAKADLDWSLVLELAREEGFAPLLVRQIEANDAKDLVPSDVLAQLESTSRSRTMRSLQQTATLVNLIDDLEESGIPIIPFKGPSLASRIYEDVGIRKSGDLDLFVQKEDIPKVKNALLEKGYQSVKQFTDEEEESYIEDRLAYEFFNEASQTLVELHWALLPSHNGSTIPPGLVWERHEWARVGGSEVRCIDNSLLLTYLCAHASKHCWSKLKWILDISCLIRACSDEEIRSARTLARELGCERMLKVGFILSHELLQVSPEPFSVDELKTDHEAVNLSDEVIDRWLFEPLAEEPEIVHASWFHFRERERWRDRLPFAWHSLQLLLKPTDKDRQFASLPAGLGFLYVLLRPFRILRERFLTVGEPR